MINNQFPEDVVIEILSWLPTKDLIKFRCVSKTWLHLLKSDHHFICLHLHRSIQTNSLSIMLIRAYHENEKLQFYHAEPTDSLNNKAVELDFPIHVSSQKYFTVAGICNGLLCLVCELEKNCFDIYVWNPLTKEYITIIACPPIPSDFPINDPLTKVKFAFAFHQGSNEYKVLRIVCSYPHDDSFEKESQSLVSVYTLGDTAGLWKTTLDPISSYIDSTKASLLNGSLHWLACNPFDPIQRFIVSFDVKDEVFQEISLPNSFNYYDSDTKVRELGGMICVFLYHYHKVVEVWGMKEYGVVGSWTKLFKVGWPEIGGEFYLLEPLAVVNSGEIVIRKNELELVLYNPNTNSIRTLETFGFEFHKAYTYIGSLLSPRVIDGIRKSDTY